MPTPINASSCNGMMRNIYQNTNRQYQYPNSVINDAMNEIGRYTAAQMNTMNNMAATVNSQYTQFSNIPNSNGTGMHIRQVNKSNVFYFIE